MDLSIIIPAKNEATDLPACLEAVHRELSGALCYEVLLVDNGSTDDTREIARVRGARVLEYRTGTISDLRNAGAAQSSGRLLAFIDADVILQAGWLDGLRDAMAILDSDEGALCGELYGIGDKPSRIERAWFDPALRPHVRHIGGGNMVLPRSLFERVGGFDGTLETGEDADLCRRVESAGGSVRRIARMVTHHRGNPATIRAFFRREAWHGVGDFTNLQAVRASKVAQLTLAWLGLHIGAIVFLPISWIGAVACWLAALGICGASAAAKYGPRGPILTRTALYYLYYAGRSLAACRCLISSRNRTGSGRSGASRQDCTEVV